MERVVLDTYTRISALLFGGKPRTLVNTIQPPGYLQLISEPLLAEYQRVLIEKFSWTPEDTAAQLQTIRSECELVHPLEIIAVSRDPDDDRILECAVAGQADYIITGDRDLLVLSSFREISILTVRQFLDRLSAPQVPLK